MIVGGLVAAASNEGVEEGAYYTGLFGISTFIALAGATLWAAGREVKAAHRNGVKVPPVSMVSLLLSILLLVVGGVVLFLFRWGATPP